MLSAFLNEAFPAMGNRTVNPPPIRKGILQACLLAGVIFSSCLQAAELSSSEIIPSEDTTPILTIKAADQQQRVSLADIEQLPLHDVSLQHPEGPEGVYSGVLLRDFLNAYELDDASRLRLIAVDNYSVFLKQAQLQEKAYLLVTRFDGAPVPRSQLGPLLVVVPEDAEAVLKGEEPLDKWIWGLATIDAG